MRDFKDNKLAERLRNQAQAKEAMIKKMRAMPSPDDPAVIKRNEERKALAEARAARQAERAEAKAHELAERKVADARAKAEREELEERQRREKTEQQLAREAELKAARDARYAARKKRKGKK